MSTLIHVEAEAAACVFITHTSARAKAHVLASIDARHFGQQPCADFWAAAKTAEATGSSLMWQRLCDTLQASKASHPQSPSWRHWFMALQELGGAYLHRGDLTPEERADEIIHDLLNAHELREVRRVCLEGAGRTEQRGELGATLRAELLERLATATQPAAEDGLVSVRQAAHELVDELQAKRGELLPSPWPGLDIHAPLTRGSLTLVAAATGVGKSVLGVQYARACAAAGQACMYVSLEVKATDMLKRLVRQEEGVFQYPERLQGEAAAKAHSAFLVALTELVKRELPIEWACKPEQTTDDVAMRAKAMRAQLEEQGKRLGLVVVDYIGLLSNTSNDNRQKRERHEMLGEYAQRLKLLARALDAPVIALAQLNREAEKAGTGATRSMIGDSYAMLRHADNVLILSRPMPGMPATGDERPRLSVQKAREGSPAWFHLAWNDKHERYEMTND